MIQEVISQWWNEAKQKEYFNYVLLGSLIILFGLGGWKGLEWYQVNREQKAQLAFSDALDEFQTSLYYVIAKPNEKGKIEDHLKDAALAFSIVLDQHSGSSLAPYAKAFLSEIHVLKKEFNEALELLRDAAKKVGKSSPLYYLYQTKIALLLITVGQEAEGVAELEALAQDSSNKQSDDAAYFLGEYYWSRGNHEKVISIWNRFSEENQPKSVLRASPWGPVVQAKLKQIS